MPDQTPKPIADGLLHTLAYNDTRHHQRADVQACARELLVARARVAELEEQARLQAAYEAWLQGQHGIDDAYWTEFLEWRKVNTDAE